MKVRKIILISFFILFTSLYSKTPYVILISFDGFRWDYVSRDLTPNLQQMIDNGAYASSLRPVFPSKTFPNHYSLVTGLYPEHHGIISNGFKNLYTGDTYRLNGQEGKLESKWYLGEAFWETAERNGITSASYFWPGSSIDDENRRPTYFKYYDHDKPYTERIDTLIKWLRLPEEIRPHFITIYFHETDDVGHKYGPNSVEINKAIQKCDSLVAYLNAGLKSIGMEEKVNVIIVSDHGMTEIYKGRIINIEKLLEGFDYYSGDSGPFMLIQPKKNETEEVYDLLKKNESHYKVYTKENIPEHYHYNESDLIPELILIADKGWSLLNNRDIENWGEYEDAATHGFDNNILDMHGLFIASGPAFRKNYKTGTIWNIDLYPLLCEIFELPQRSNIDGKLERIKFILEN